jgi:DnaJ-class molecular chaperone
MPDQPSTEALTMPTYSAATCRRCKGSGEFSFGKCYGCSGCGVVQIENGRRPMTADELAAYEEDQAGIAARAARAAARAARRAAREAA